MVAHYLCVPKLILTVGTLLSKAVVHTNENAYYLRLATHVLKMKT